MSETPGQPDNGEQGKGSGPGRFLSRRVRIIIGIVAVAFIAWCFVFEPVTRNFVAQDATCLYCHYKTDYEYAARMSFTTQHPAELKHGEKAARCVDCHLPRGFWASAFAYTHFASITDLYGHFRDRPAERAGKWIPLSAARAYRVRDRLYEYDSVTCHNCHIMSEIKPKQARGRKAHADAVKDGETCIECHANLVHRFVAVRTEAQMQDSGAGEEGMDEGMDEGLEGDTDSGSGGSGDSSDGLDDL